MSKLLFYFGAYAMCALFCSLETRAELPEPRKSLNQVGHFLLGRFEVGEQSTNIEKALGDSGTILVVRNLPREIIVEAEKCILKVEKQIHFGIPSTVSFKFGKCVKK